MLVAALVAAVGFCLAVGAVAVGLAFEDHCLAKAGDRASAGPNVQLVPPRLECTYESAGVRTTETDAAPGIAFELGWLVATAVVITVILVGWARFTRPRGDRGEERSRA